MTNRMTTIIRHEGVKDSGSYEVKFSDGRAPKFFKWDDDPSQRVRPSGSSQWSRRFDTEPFEDGQVFGWQENLDASGNAGLAANETVPFEGDDHLVDRRWADTEMALDVGFSGRLSGTCRNRYV